MRLPLIAALGLLATSFGALIISLGGHGGRAVDHLVTVPGVTQAQASGVIGLPEPKGDSPFAVYVPPAGGPAPPPTSAPAPAAPAEAPAAPAPGGGFAKHHHG